MSKSVVSIVKGTDADKMVEEAIRSSVVSNPWLNPVPW